MSDFIIGSDETLKGDTFGGLVVAGVKADEALRRTLLEIGVADSKKIADAKILRLAEKIRGVAKHKVIALTPFEYNQHSLNYNMNKLHLQVGQALRPGIHVVDLYPGCTVGDVKETKAEELYPEVAAASILAREAGLLQFEQLSKELGFRVPKGSTHVKDALEKLKELGKDPQYYVKMHFKNVRQVFEK